jgi:hypothetical protein
MNRHLPRPVADGHDEFSLDPAFVSAAGLPTMDPDVALVGRLF